MKTKAMGKANLKSWLETEPNRIYPCANNGFVVQEANGVFRLAPISGFPQQKFLFFQAKGRPDGVYAIKVLSWPAYHGYLGGNSTGGPLRIVDSSDALLFRVTSDSSGAMISINNTRMCIDANGATAIGKKRSLVSISMINNSNSQRFVIGR